MTKNQTLKIGTRGSKLALYQANKVKDAFEQTFPSTTFEIVIIKTKGDKILDVALSKIGDKGLFTKEIEDALLRGDIDIAVHSLKDLPTVLPEGLQLGGVLPRAEFRDAFVHIDGKKVNELTDEDIVATSSLRRRAQMLKINPELKIVDIRGNVDTRLRKMKEGHCTAMIMAAAGLQRLGFGSEISEIINEDTVIPAVSQGIIAIESRDNDTQTQEYLDAITCQDALRAAKAERTFLNVLEGGCQIPVGCYTKSENDSFTIKGYVSDVDGTNAIIETLSGEKEKAVETAKKLAETMIAKGADKILEKIRNQAEK